MNSQLLNVAIQSFTLLRRDRIFVPAVIGGLLVAFIAYEASTFVSEGAYKVLFDIGSFGFHVLGALIAIFWGSKSINDSKAEGSLELQLSAPVSRPIWFLGKYFGLSAILILLFVAYAISFQVLAYVTRDIVYDYQHFLSLGLFAVEWLAIAAMASCFSTFSSFTVAFSVSILFWIVGLISAGASRIMENSDALIGKVFIDLVSSVWNLQAFNTARLVTSGAAADPSNWGPRFLYGLTIIAIFCTIGMIALGRKDPIT